MARTVCATIIKEFTLLAAKLLSSAGSGTVRPFILESGISWRWSWHTDFNLMLYYDHSLSDYRDVLMEVITEISSFEIINNLENCTNRQGKIPTHVDISRFYCTCH